MKSYTLTIKSEICRLPLKDNCCAAAELLGVICYGSHLKNNTLNIRVENATIAKRVFSLARIVTGRSGSLYKTEYNKKTIHTVQIAEADTLSEVLDMFGLVKCSRDLKSFVMLSVSTNFVDKQCCKQAFLRGAFLINGTSINPEKQYHLELSTTHRRLYKDTVNIMNELNLKSKFLNRNNRYLIYFKDSESIADFLGNIGATKCMLDYENVRIWKGMTNNMNRAINCEAANKSKSQNASSIHIQAIEKIERTIGLESLENGLREIAYLRIEYPDISLSELSNITGGNISRSGINHRLKKIIEISESIKEKE